MKAQSPRTGAPLEIDPDVAERLGKVPARYKDIVTMTCGICGDGVLQVPAQTLLAPSGLPADALVAGFV